MNTRMQVQLLPDGRRLHLHDGPIDLILEALGEMREIDTAYRAAVRRFTTVLDELCSELSFLRCRSILMALNRIAQWQGAWAPPSHLMPRRPSSLLWRRW